MSREPWPWTKEWRDRKLADRYRDEMGHDPPADPDHPLAGQWDYRGTREERDALALELGQKRELPEIHPDQETLI